MGAFSIWHWLIVLIVVVLIFGGRGKISSIMEDLSKGIKAFRKGVNSEDTDSNTPNNSKASNDKQ